ncbi:hypothetical protein G4B88_030867 [Cannabis sativa]|uniref:Endoplasmic reticulum-Golgi intermediate compartment protein 3 n=1 Tax=Cannabis sativa TaxID=3483 RepID=A0A7J6DJW9_CANSA|nr:hypothetical protein G4B88_030867 [Cannabis sativa]
MDSIMRKVRNLDAYPKINEDFYKRTLSGGLITIASSIVMVLLFLSELRLYLHAATQSKLVVDTSRGETLRINFDVTFPAFPCFILSLDAMDISGEQHLDIKHDARFRGNVIEITKQDGIGASKIDKPLQKHGGRHNNSNEHIVDLVMVQKQHQIMLMMKIVVILVNKSAKHRKKGWALSNPDMIDQCKREDEEGEGCNVYGFLEVNKVAGNFHFAPGKSFQQSNIHVHDLLSFQKDILGIFPGVVNPLDGVEWTHEFITPSPNGMYQYFIKVVPTVYTHVSGQVIQSNQFSVTEHIRTSEYGNIQFLPGVTFAEEYISFSHFLTNVCAIVGGVFTVSGILDSFIYHGHKVIKKKMEIDLNNIEDE